ncbi:MAG: hypothetical protein Q7S44_01770 [bacterium]|nr:hypothetical protein [bacterium]
MSQNTRESLESAGAPSVYIHHFTSEIYKGLQDVTTTQEVVLEPGRLNQVPVEVTTEHAPQSSNHEGTTSPRGSLRNQDLSSSLRSRFAQLGLDLMDYDLTQHISRALEGSDDEVKVRVPAPIINYCARPITVLEGTRLFRFFSNFSSNLITGECLKAMVASGKIKVDGEPEKDWDWHWRYGGNNPGVGDMITGIRVKVRPLGWIPPDSPQPICISDSEANYRQTIDSLLDPRLPSGLKQVLWIGETPHLKLDENVDALLDRKVPPGLTNFCHGAWGLHINSLFVDGGTNWPVRVEVLSTTEPKMMPNAVVFYFSERVRDHIRHISLPQRPPRRLYSLTQLFSR